MGHEQMPNAHSQIDQDLKDLEHFSDTERFEFVRDILREIVRGERFDGVNINRQQVRTAEYHGAQVVKQFDAESLPVSSSDVAEYALPDIPSPYYPDERPLGSMREMPELSHDSYSTSEHLLLPVAQGYMYRVPRSEAPYMYATISECSVVVGYTADQVLFSHVSFSRDDQVQATQAKFAELGVQPADTYVIANTDTEPEHGYTFSQYRHNTAEQYKKTFGVPRGNVIEFKYNDRERSDLSRRDIVEVMADSSGIYVAQSANMSRTHKFTDETHWQRHIAVNK